MTFTKVSDVNFPHITNPVLAIDIKRTGYYYRNQTLAVGLALYEPGKGISNYRFTPDRSSNCNWENKYVDEFWSDNPDLLKDILSAPTEKWSKFVKIIGQLDAEYPNFMICSASNIYDIAYINHDLQYRADVRGLYYKPDGTKRNIIDINSFLVMFDIHNPNLCVDINQLLANNNLTVSTVRNNTPENTAAYTLESFLTILNFKLASV